MVPIDQFQQDYKDKKVLIFGLGLLGGAAKDAAFFASMGAKVKATDQKSAAELKTTLDFLAPYTIDYTLGNHTQADIDWADVIVRNPGVSNNHPLMEYARSQKKPVVMRSSLFAAYAQCPIIGITGTRGKTTTTAMIHHLLSALSGKQCLLGGNLNDISDLELLSHITKPDQTYAILELSSWQLQGFREAKLSPHIAVATNLYPDHLNKYPDQAAYYLDKQAIIAHQHTSDFFIANANQSEFREWVHEYPGRVVWFSKQDLSPDMKLKNNADHNRDNAAAALAVAKVCGLDETQAQNLLTEFKGVPFRQQIIREHKGITWINDTTATSPDATIAAINTYNQNTIYLLGGADKHLPLQKLATAINSKLDKIILFSGAGTDRLIPLLDEQKIMGVVSSMESAVKLANSSAKLGDTIILSPGFASFGIFINEFDRGTQFNQCVQNLP